LCFLAALAASAQQPAPSALHYDTVSIHEATRDAGGSITMSGGFGDLHIATVNLVNWRLHDIVSFAFGSAFYQVEGVPPALDGRFYVLRAQSGDETNALLKPLNDAQAEAAQQRMLQEVLVQRFHLRYHAVNRDLPSFLLVAGKHLKLHPSAVKPLVPGDGRTRDSTDSTQPSYAENCEGRGCTLTAHGQSMQWLAEMLDNQLGGLVSDHTSLPGLYDFTLQWTSRSSETDDDEFPPVEAALADRLVLKIEHANPRSASSSSTTSKPLQRISKAKSLETAYCCNRIDTVPSEMFATARSSFPS
jgi:uncharacterized protein (TIGR03435 family)